jgi:hypothetical protein
MAIRTLTSSRLNPRREATLRKALVAEMERKNDVPAPTGAPVIYREESGTPERYTHWYVVWEKFKGIHNEDRSGIILDAVETAFGREEALKVTTAMGLVPDEPLALDLAEQAEEPPATCKSAAVAEGRAAYGSGKRAKGKRT